MQCVTLLCAITSSNDHRSNSTRFCLCHIFDATLRLDFTESCNRASSGDSLAVVVFGSPFYYKNQATLTMAEFASCSGFPRHFETGKHPKLNVFLDDQAYAQCLDVLTKVRFVLILTRQLSAEEASKLYT